MESRRQPEKPKGKRKELLAGVKLYVDDGQGVGAPMTKYIFTDTLVVNQKYICAYQSYREGKKIITVDDKPFFGYKRSRYHEKILKITVIAVCLLLPLLALYGCRDNAEVKVQKQTVPAC